MYFDPPIASGYQFTLDMGPNIDSVTIVTGSNILQNTPLLTVTFDGQTGTVAPGGTFDFPSGGVTEFTLTGINPLDVSNNPGVEFLTSFTFHGGGQGQITETVLQAPNLGRITFGASDFQDPPFGAPELGSTAIWLSGLTCCFAYAWLKGQASQQCAAA
jgi:hypothetical protein